MKSPYLGRIKLRWCKECNLPVLGKFCSKCGESTHEVPISPPGDVRPAFEGDVDLINRTVKERFGCDLIPEGRIVCLNATSGQDRFDEVIMDGRVQGVLKYDVKVEEYDFMPRLAGGRRIWQDKGGKWVRLHPSAKEYILKGASVLLPGVEDFDPNIKEGDEVIVVCEDQVIGVGKARFSADEARERDKGMFVKIRRHGEPDHEGNINGNATWDDAVEANTEVIHKYETEAIRFIEKTARTNLTPAVAFSGGKDSLVTLILVKKALGDVIAVFIDTGLEYPETVEHVERTVEEMGVNLIIERAGDGFFKGVEYFGPPGRDFRWCCKICKLGPTARVIQHRFGGEVLNFIGQRAYESATRAKSSRTWRNHWLPNQMAASPIQYWTALHIWLYLMREGVDVNTLYKRGLKRIGCWACPASDLSEIEVLKETHPDLWGKWCGALEEGGMTEEAVNKGLWRWKDIPKGQRAVLEGTDQSKKRERPIFYYSTHNDMFKVEGELDFTRVSNLAKTLGGKVAGDRIEVGDMVLRKDGTFQVSGDDDLMAIFGLMERAQRCFGCGVCLAQCPNDAIEIIDGRALIGDGCISCGKCHDRCPIVKYKVDEAEFVKRDL